MKLKAQSLTVEARRWQFWLLLSFGATLVFWLYGTFECTPLMPWCATSTGLATEILYSRYPSATVTSVAGSSPAALGGIRENDRIDFKDIGFRERWVLRDMEYGYAGPAGVPLRYVLHRSGRVYAATIVPIRVPATWPTPLEWFTTLSAVWALLLGALLAWRRPDSIEARLLCLIILLWAGLPPITYAYAPWPAMEFAGEMLNGTTVPSGMVILLTILAARFARPLSRVRTLLVTFGITGAVLIFTYHLFFVLGFVFPTIPWFPRLWTTGLTLGFLAAFASLIAGAFASQGVDRQRAMWIAVSVAPLCLFYGIVPSLLSLAPTFNDSLLSFLARLPYLATPFGFTYAILTRRSLDIGYAVNRAAVFGGLSLLVLAVFVVVEWALSSWAGAASHTTSIVVNVLVALALGLSLRAVHRRTERFVDRVFFSKRRDNEMALRRFAREAAFVTDHRVLLSQARNILSERAGASSVEVLLSPDGIPANDPAVLALRAWHEPVELRRYETVLHGEMAFPMVSKGQLLGVLICGAKRSGEGYAPDEIAALDAVARGVGLALGALQDTDREGLGHVVAALSRIQELQTELLTELRALRNDGHRDRDKIQ